MSLCRDEQHLFEVGGFLVIRHVEDLGFKDPTEGDDWLATVLLHPLIDLQQAMPIMLMHNNPCTIPQPLKWVRTVPL